MVQALVSLPALECRGRRIALDVARGLHYLHANNVIHFDLKSANILLARDDTAKLADVSTLCGMCILHSSFVQPASALETSLRATASMPAGAR